MKQAIIQDALDRITDWVLSGGKLTDPYVQRQYAFVKEVLGRDWNVERHHPEKG